MSFSSDVKTELCRTPPARRCCAQAEVYGILLYCNTFTGQEVRVVTENEAFSRRLPLLMKKAFKFDFDALPGEERGEEEKRVFLLDSRDKLALLQETFGSEEKILAHHINFAVLEESCCRTAFLRGAFLAGGSVTNPQKGYHMEIATPHFNVGREMPALMHEAGFFPKETVRKANYMVYFKRSEWIEDFLTAIGAPISAMKIMNAKVERQLRGSVNRRVNCDAANLDKVVEAAQLQIEAIRRLSAAGQMDRLPEKLRQTARLRLEHPEETLSELALLTTPPVSRSALNHRLRKLVELGKDN